MESKELQMSQPKQYLLVGNKYTKLKKCKTDPICRKCKNPLKEGDEIVSKKASRGSTQHYHLICAKMVNIVW